LCYDYDTCKLYLFSIGCLWNFRAATLKIKECIIIITGKLKSGIRFLAQEGLNLFAIIDCAALPDKVTEMIVGSGVPLADFQRLVLVGHGGRRLWEALKTRGMKTADPVDQHSVTFTRQFITDYLDDSPVLWLYPNTDYMIPLQQLGELAGWSYPSPLGSGISPIYGVWFAYRTAFLTNLDLPVIGSDPAPSPCTTCTDKPCIATCPVDAVQENVFGIDACVNHRLRPGSTCADRCLSRMACPFFPEHQYTLEQIQYHYGQSLSSLQTWITANED